jgi:RNA polymerase sigma-70 factor (ECF subfamily)
VSRESPEARTGGSLPDLVQRIQAGEATAEAELVERFSRGLGLALRRLAPSAALADDLLQQTLWLTIRKVRQGEIADPERLAGFIHSTARNLFIADRRKEARYVTAAEDLPPALREATAGAAQAEPSPLQQVLREEEARLARQLLGELRVGRDRELLLRFYLASDSKEDICRDLGVDPERFSRVLHRARERFRDLWQRAEKRRTLERYRR